MTEPFYSAPKILFSLEESYEQSARAALFSLIKRHLVWQAWWKHNKDKSWNKDGSRWPIMFCHVQIFSTQMPEDDDDDDDDAFAVAPLWPLASMENEVQMTDPMLLHRGRDKKQRGFQTVSVNGGRTLFWSVSGSSQSCTCCCYYAAISGGFCLLKLLLLCCVVAANQRLWRSSTVYSDQPNPRRTPHCHGTSKHTSSLMMRPLDFMTVALFKQWATLT